MPDKKTSKVKFPLLAVDLGLKTTGLAWASNQVAVEVLKPIKMDKTQQVFSQVLDLVKSLKIKTVVIGRPEQGEVVYWAKQLSGYLEDKATGLEVFLHPETLSSQKAWTLMSRLDYSFKAKKELNDSFAALEILKDFLA